MNKFDEFKKIFSEKSRHHKKLIDFVLPELRKISNANILEFGVSKDGMSTELFLEYSQERNCNLFSVDVVDYKNKFLQKEWNFILGRDDDFNFIKDKIPNEFELILLDTVHEAKHVENILYNYYENLKEGYCFFIDDINWIPYLKNSEKDHFYGEINNLETFNKLLEIYSSNRDKIEMEFTFLGTGMCKIKKISSQPLDVPAKINSRKNSLKNLFRSFFKRN